MRLAWKLYVGLSLLCFFWGIAQADLRIPGPATYQVVGRGLTWAGTLNNNFIMDITSPSTGMCVAIQNNDAGTHTYSLNAFETSDLQQTIYTGQTGRWTPIPVTPGVSGSALGNSLSQLWINTSGAAHVVLAFAGGAGTGTADVTISQTPNFCGGGATVSGCSKSLTQIVPTAGNAIVIPAPAAGLFIHVCAYHTSGQVTSSGTITWANGTAGACTVLGATLWQGVATTGNPSDSLAVSAPSQLFQTTVAGQPLCGSNNPGTGANHVFAASYAVF